MLLLFATLLVVPALVAVLCSMAARRALGKIDSQHQSSRLGSEPVAVRSPAEANFAMELDARRSVA